MWNKNGIQHAVIANKGFSGSRRFVARFNFRCTLTGDSHAIPYWPYRQPLYTS
jgi:hypothetical protein